MPAEPQSVGIEVDVTGLPEVMTLAHAARNVVDRAEGRDLGDSELALYMRRLEAALRPILPGAVTDGG